MGVKRVELWIAALMALALFTPIFSGYVLGVAILILVAVDRANIDDSRPKKIFRRLTVPLGWRLLTLWICIFAAATGAALMTENPDWKQWRSATGNFAVKISRYLLKLPEATNKLADRAPTTAKIRQCRRHTDQGTDVAQAMTATRRGPRDPLKIRTIIDIKAIRYQEIFARLPRSINPSPSDDTTIRAWQYPNVRGWPIKPLIL